MADTQVQNVETSVPYSGDYEGASSGACRSNTGVICTAISDSSTDNMYVRTSTDGVTWTTALTYTAGANETILEGARALVDEDDYFHVFATYNDSVLGNKFYHWTNRSGSWVKHDITSTIGYATSGWTRFRVEYFGDSGTCKVWIAFHISSSSTIRVSEYNLETQTQVWNEDALGADSGSITDTYFVMCNRNSGALGTVAVWYIKAGVGRYARRTGVATWGIGNVTYSYSVTRNTLRFLTASCTTIGVVIVQSSHDGVDERLEVLSWDDSTYNLSRYAYFKTQGSSQPTDAFVSTNAASELYVTYSQFSGVPTTYWWVEGANSTAWPTSIQYGNTILGSGASSNPDYSVVGHLSQSPQSLFTSSYTTSSYAFLYHSYNTTGPVTQRGIYNPSGTLYSILPAIPAFEPELAEQIAEGSDEFVGARLPNQFQYEGVEASDDIVGVGLHQYYEVSVIASDSYITGGTNSRSISDTADGTDEFSAEKVTGARANNPYPYYACVAAGTQYPSGTLSASYPAYTCSAVGAYPYYAYPVNEPYPSYEATGEGTSQIGGNYDQYTTLYPEYECTAVGSVGWLGTADISYGVYGEEEDPNTDFFEKPYYAITSLTPNLGTASSSYRAYTILVATPGVGATDTDSTGTADNSYQNYTVSASTIPAVHGTALSTYSQYPRYIAIGYGLGDTYADVVSEYPSYEIYATGESGSVGTADLEYPVVATAYDSNNVEFSSYVISASGYWTDITGTASMSYPRMLIDAIGSPDDLEVYTGRLVDSDGIAFTANNDFIVIYDPTPPEYEVMFSSMNLQKKAVTEYHNFSFNSISRNGENIYASNHNGIYIVLGSDSDDDGDNIVANVEKLETDYDTGMRKRATDAYVYLQSDGSYEFSSVADGTRSDQTISDTDTVMHTRKIDLAKGLIGRGLGWAIRSEGTDFEIEEVELVVDVGSRRSKRYG